VSDAGGIGAVEGGTVGVTEGGREVVVTGAFVVGDDAAACDLDLCEGEEQLVAPNSGNMAKQATTPTTFGFIWIPPARCSREAERLR
jgi:hypothetical protein